MKLDLGESSAALDHRLVGGNNEAEQRRGGALSHQAHQPLLLLLALRGGDDHEDIKRMRERSSQAGHLERVRGSYKLKVSRART